MTQQRNVQTKEKKFPLQTILRLSIYFDRENKTQKSDKIFKTLNEKATSKIGEFG
jgi:hypothetical protein